MRQRAVMGLMTTVAMLAMVGCDDDRGPYDTCDVGENQCVDVDGCSVVRVEYPDHGATAGICTNVCSSDLDCPLDVRGIAGACLSFDGGSLFTCFERCVSTADCPGGLGCVDRLPDASGTPVFFDPVCLPQ